jgi:aminopeptidase N
VTDRDDVVASCHASGNLGANGWQFSKSGGAFAAGEPHVATAWFPANDTPRDKATITLDARVPDGWTTCFLLQKPVSSTMRTPRSGCSRTSTTASPTSSRNLSVSQA